VTAQAAKKARVERIHLRAIIEEAPVSIAMFDREMRYLAASRYWLADFGLGYRDVIGRLHYEMVRDIPERWKEIHRRALAGETLRENDAPFQHPDGRTQWICWEARPWHRADDAIGGVIIFANDVTARVEAERAARESNAKLAAETKALARLNEASSRLWQTQDLHEGLGEMLAATIELLGAEKGCVQLFDAGRNVLQIAAQRGFEQDFLEFFHEVSETDESASGRALRTRETIVIEDVEQDESFTPFRPIVRAAGSRAVVAAPLLDRGGTPLGVLTAHFPLPHRPSDSDLQRLRLYQHQAANFIARCANEKTSRESEERFRALVTTTSHIVFCATRDGNEVRQFDGNGFLSDAEEPCEAWLDKYIYAEDQPHLWRAIRQAIETKSPFDLEHRVRRADGTVGWVHTRAVPLLDAAGGLREWFGAAQDVTARREAEDALRDSEERLRLAVEASRMGMWDRDLRTGTATWNNEYYRMLGLRVGEIEPGYAVWLTRVHPNDRDAAEAKVERAMREHREYLNEYRILCPDGTVRWCIARGEFFYDDAGQPVRMIGLAQDVTEVRQQAERQRVLVAELQHRTRNLMAVVHSIAQQTLATAESLADFENRFNRRLAGLSRVQNLLSRAEDEPITVGALIGMELEALCSNELGNKITIAGPDVPLRKSAVQMLCLAVHELATNALKYGALVHEGGSLSVTWRIEKSASDRRLRLDWIERGIAGMPAAAAIRRGYGRTLIEEALPYTLSARTRFELGPDALRCVISLPLATRDGKEVVG
jgi:PAS domain S-box-containing protein